MNEKIKKIETVKKIRYITRLSQRAFGKEFNVSGAYIGQIETELEPSEKIYNQIIGKYGYLLNDKYDNQSNYVLIDYYPDVIASCGPGGFEMSQECIQYNVPATLFPPARNVKGYSMCHAKGNSMYPRIWDGDFVICEHKDNMKIENGEMYIFCFDDQIYLKRLTKNINQIVVESENPDFPTQYIEKEDMNNVHLIGHVVCSGRMNGKYLDKRI